MCTGLFAASAITSATSITSLIPLAIEVLRLAFRTGSLVADLAEKLEPGSRESWATAVHVKNLEKLEATLGTFHNENVSHPLNAHSANLTDRRASLKLVVPGLACPQRILLQSAAHQRWSSDCSNPANICRPLKRSKSRYMDRIMRGISSQKQTFGRSLDQRRQSSLDPRQSGSLFILPQRGNRFWL